MSSFTFKQVRPNSSPPTNNKAVVVMGATATGKSRLAIDLAAIFSGEVINSDKIQVYKGLDAISNKVLDEECHSVPQHLLDVVIDPDEDFAAGDFVCDALLVVEDITRRGHLPIIVGGYNSFVEALIDDRGFRAKYELIVFWIEVSTLVLRFSMRQMVEHMVSAGLAAEAREFSSGDYSRKIRWAIGVPEMKELFKKERLTNGEEDRAGLFSGAIEEIKENTYKLTLLQMERIFAIAERRQWRGVHLLDAAVACMRCCGGEAWEMEWERTSVGPAVRVLSDFLMGRDGEEMVSKVGLNFSTSFQTNAISLAGGANN